MVNTKIRLIIAFAAKNGETLHSKQKQDLELTVAQIMSSLLPNLDLKLKKAGKTTRAFRHDLNQIPYYSGSNKQIQGIRSDRVLEELQMEVCDIVQKTGSKTIPKKK